MKMKTKNYKFYYILIQILITTKLYLKVYVKILYPEPEH